MLIWFRRATAIILLIGAIVVFGTLLPRPLLLSSEVEGMAPAREILLIHNPIHTDIALPLDPETRAAFAELADYGFAVDHPDAAHIVFGWGGRAFYTETPTWADLKPLPVFKALTVDRSVMHVDLAAEIPEGLPQVRRLDVTETGYDELIAAIRQSFLREGNRLQKVGQRGYGDIDLFFEANGRFNALVGCNTWTAAMLRRAGLRTGFWTPLPQLLDISLDLHAAQPPIHHMPSGSSGTN